MIRTWSSKPWIILLSRDLIFKVWNKEYKVLRRLSLSNASVYSNVRVVQLG